MLESAAASMAWGQQRDATDRTPPLPPLLTSPCTLVWQAVLYSIFELAAGDDVDLLSALLTWVRHCVAGYHGVNMTTWTESFNDGRALCAILHHHDPACLDFGALNPAASAGASVDEQARRAKLAPSVLAAPLLARLSSPVLHPVSKFSTSF